MADSAGVGEMLRQAPVQERAPQRQADMLRPTNMPTRNPAQEADDAARMLQLQHFLRQEAPGAIPNAHDLPHKPSADTHGNERFNLAEWFKDVFHYLTNSMFQKKG